MADPVYTVERLNWRTAADVGWLLLPGADPVRTFHDRAVAAAQARECEWEVRRRVNPFRLGGPFLHYQTGFDAERLYDWFLDLGLDPPGPTTDSAAWAEAWDRALPHMTDAQRAAAWEALDRVRFFRVAERPPGRPMHLVALPHFEEDPVSDDGFGPAGTYVGGTPYMVVRRPETADEMCRELYLDRVVREGGYVGEARYPKSWVAPDPDSLAGEKPREDQTFGLSGEYYAEHRPLELIADHDPTPGREVFVVLRRHWRLERTERAFWRWSLTQAKSCGRPVAAYGTLAAADARMAGLEAEARRHPAPFRFGPPHEWGTLHGPAIWGVLDKLAPVEFTNAWADYAAPDRLWARWWDETVPRLTPEQVETVWGLYDRLKFYEAVAVEYRE